MKHEKFWLKNNHKRDKINISESCRNNDSSHTFIDRSRNKAIPSQLTEDHSLKNMLMDSFDNPCKNASPNSVNSMGNQRSHNSNTAVNRKKMWSSVRTNFAQYHQFNGAANYRTTWINKNKNLKQYMSNNDQYNSSAMHPPNVWHKNLSIRVSSNHSPHSMVSGKWTQNIFPTSKTSQRAGERGTFLGYHKHSVNISPPKLTKPSLNSTSSNKRRASPPDSKVSYHSHYLNHEESPQSLVLDNIKGAKLSMPFGVKEGEVWNYITKKAGIKSTRTDVDFRNIQTSLYREDLK